jgi:hypothetical protein
LAAFFVGAGAGFVGCVLWLVVVFVFDDVWAAFFVGAGTGFVGCVLWLVVVFVFDDVWP